MRQSCSYPVQMFTVLICCTVAAVLVGVAVREQTRMSPYQVAIVASSPPLTSIFSVPRSMTPQLADIYKSSVPHILWQTSKSHDGAPALATQLVLSWSSYNPTYDHLLLDDTELDTFVLEHYNRTVLEAFQDMPVGVMKADAFRYMAIYHHGGVYADMDTECKRPIETWVKPGCQLVVAVQDDEYFCQWAFAGTPRHPALQAVLDLVLHRMIHKTVSPEEGDYVFKVTGPGVFTEGLRAYLGLQTDEKLKGFVEEKGRVMKDGVCLISRAELKRALRNMYSSTNKWLQGGTWSGWVTAQDSLIGINGKVVMGVRTASRTQVQTAPSLPQQHETEEQHPPG